MSVNVILGMSGGVDSSVSAYILKQRGYNVIGIFMLNWDEKNTSFCSITKDLADTQKICNFLKIKLHIVNFSFDYWNEIFLHFLNEYKIGKTPNPDIICNSKIKFNIFLEYSKYLGANYIATGHYAKIKLIKNKYILLVPFDLCKDQTYFLYKLIQYQLKYILYPLYKYSKSFIRNLAFSIGLYNSMKKDSNGICFIEKLDFKNFLKKFISICYGPVINFCAKQIDIHEGIMFYTYGQKKKIINEICFFLPHYIFNKNLYKNYLLVSKNVINLLDEFICIVNNINLINFFSHFDIKCFVKIRHGYVKEKCFLKILTGNIFIIKFFNVKNYITLGQSVVFYKNDICLGGGIITNFETKY